MRGGVPVFRRAVGKPRRRSVVGEPARRRLAEAALRPHDASAEGLSAKKRAGRKDYPSRAIAFAAGTDDAADRAALNDQPFDQYPARS